MTSIALDPTYRGKPRWIAWGKYDGVNVKVTVWSEDITRISQAGYSIPDPNHSGVDGQPISIPVILEWRDSCGYAIGEVIAAPKVELADVNGPDLREGYVIRWYDPHTSYRWRDQEILKLDLNRDGKPQMHLMGQQYPIGINKAKSYKVLVSSMKAEVFA